MTNFNITLQRPNGSQMQMSKTEVTIIFEGLNFDKFQNQLIRIVNDEKSHAVITNSRGSEIFAMRYSPECDEGICCAWTNEARLRRFIKSFNNHECSI